MKILCVVTVVGVSLLGSMGSASAQRYGDPYDGYSRPRDRDYEDQERPRYRERRVAFDEREYLRCHPDVRRAVRRGETSAWEHYQRFGRREGRELTC